MKRINIAAELCDGCMECVQACEEHLSLERREIPLPESGESSHSACFVRKRGDYFVPVVCRQCTSPFCERTCMSGAICRNAETGRLMYEKERCGACFMCVMSCPYGMPKPDPEMNSVIKCDFCRGEDKPLCVEACTRGALCLG